MQTFLAIALCVTASALTTPISLPAAAVPAVAALSPEKFQHETGAPNRVADWSHSQRRSRRC